MTEIKFKELPDLIQGTDEWLAVRAQHVTATEVAHLKSGHTSLYDLISRKRGLTQAPDLSKNPAVMEGKIMEPQIRSFLERSLGPLTTPCLESVEEPFFMASLDGWSSKGFVVEIKNLFHRQPQLFEEIKQQGVMHPHVQHYGYYYQVQWQLYCTGAQVGILVFNSPDANGRFTPGRQLFFKFGRDEKVIEELKQIGYRVKEIMQNNLPVTPEAGDEVPLTIEQLDAVKDEINRYKLAELELKQLQEKIDLLKSIKKEVIDSLSSKLLTGNITKIKSSLFSLTKIEKKGVVDMDRMVADGIIPTETLEKYRKPGSTSYRLTLAK